MRAGQNIYKLCRQYYGISNATLMDIVIDFNPDLENANVISVNQKIRLPQMTEELLLLENPDHTYQIHAGTYTSPEDGVRYHNITALKEKEIEVVPRKVSPEETWYRVVIGRFGNRDEALEMIHFLERRGLVPSSGTIPPKKASGKTEVP